MLLEKIQASPADRIAEVEDFIAARAQDRALTRAASAASASSFAKAWENPDDDAYDAL